MAALSSSNTVPVPIQVREIQHEIETLRQKTYRSLEKRDCFQKIADWETKLIQKIQQLARETQNRVTRAFDDSSKPALGALEKLWTDIHSNKQKALYSDQYLSEWQKKMKECQELVKRLPSIEIKEETSGSMPSLQVVVGAANEQRNDPSVSTEQRRADDESMDTTSTDRSELNQSSFLHPPLPQSPHPQSSFPSMTFGLDQRAANDIHRLFNELMMLRTMDKRAMSGRCVHETNQMTQFLEDVFGFENIPGQYIVDGVRDFYLKRPPHTILPERVIYFPSKTASSQFKMTIKEILKWQSSFAVYAYRNIPGMNELFIQRALRGESRDGEEAFRMKFVVRISTCPILMEFDGKVVDRKETEDWPNRIKLVSVTGIDFAGRKHDIDDIRTYILNWDQVFHTDPYSKQISLANNRDFAIRRPPVRVVLHEERLFNDLKDMARLRLRACDQEKVQIVVETGIGLGVFSGREIGIERTTQTTTAIAIRTVLQEDGPAYKHIQAVVFALPIFEDRRRPDSIHQSCFSAFTEEFEASKYQGPIPVLIADQDMHRLTVAIARRGYIVSELNPADSHGVFGEYWQNYGPAVEEKLALTTLGLLIQHHRCNSEVLNRNRYILMNS